MAGNQIPFTLKDEATGIEYSGAISNEGNGLFIHVEGYGTSTDKKGFPIMVDMFDGELSVKVWGDINQEDHTESVSLNNAKDDKREED